MGQVFFIYEGKEISKVNLKNALIIGRSSSCDVSFPDIPHVSKQHAQLIKDKDDNLFIVDLDSTHGVYLDGVRIPTGIPKPIMAGTEVSLCKIKKIQITFRKSSSSVLNSRSVEEMLMLKSEIVIGRSPDCDIILDHPSISRRHLLVKRSDSSGLYLVKDLGSLNGSYKNGHRIHGSEKVTDKDALFVGRFQVKLTSGISEIKTDIAVWAKGISKRFGESTFGLRESNFEIMSNSLTAIMGPSGCGKSTLLKAMNGDSPPSSGEVLIAGMELTQNYDYLKTLIGYVPQDDIVHYELTVEECLWYSAKLRLQAVSDKEIKEKVASVMRELNITHIKKSLVGKISGGQRKRVAIASEILTDPMILFLDEPTSPLDPQTIEEFLKILRRLARRGTAVIMVTHKPEDLAYMDAVIFMAEGGYKVYQGSTSGYLEYFKQQDTVGVYAQLAGENAHRWIESGYKKVSSNQVSQPKIHSNNGDTNFLKQYWWLTNRYMNIKLNDRVNSLIMLIQAPFIAILVSLIFDNITPAVIFIVTVSSIWFGANNAAREIVSEGAIYKRERMFNLGILPYIFSKLTVLGVFSILQTLLFSVIMFITFQGNDLVDWSSKIVENFLVICLISVVGTMMGLFLSAVSNSTEKVMTVVPLTLIPQLMLAGLITPIINPLTEFISYLTISRWGNELLSITQSEVVISQKIQIPGADQVPEENRTDSGTDAVIDASDNLVDNCFYSETYNDIFGSWASSVRLDVAVLLCLFLVFFLLTYNAIKSKDSIKINR